MRTKAILLLLVFILTLTLVSCQSDDDIQYEKLGYNLNNGIYKNNDDVMDKGPVKGGTLRLFSTFPDTLNPLTTKNSYVSDFLSFIYEGLVTLDEKQQPEPLLSDKWTVSFDGLTWNFHIREGVLWSDGEAFTSKDVEFTFNLLLNAKIDSVYKDQLENVATFSSVDPSNFKIVLIKPDSFTAEKMTFPIVPVHLQASMTADDAFKPVGTGPFKLEEYVKEKAVTLKKNDSWWYIDAREDKSKEILLMDKISVNIYKSIEDCINAFQIYDIDIACINMDDINKYTSRTDMIMKKYPSREFEFLTFNLRNPVLSDLSVRKAVAAAIDRQAIVQEILKGCATISDLPIHPGSWLIEGLNSAPAAANAVQAPKEILLEGGWKENSNGFFKSFGGVYKKLEIELLVNNNNSRRILVAERICQQLRAAGIAAKVTRLPWSGVSKLLNTGKFAMAYTGCRITQVPDISFLYSNSYLPSFHPLQENTVRNISGYNSLEANTLIEQLYKETDTERKKKILSGFKNLVNTDLPYIGLFFLDNAVIYRPSVRGSLDPNVWNKYNDITGWYLPDLQ